MQQMPPAQARRDADRERETRVAAGQFLHDKAFVKQSEAASAQALGYFDADESRLRRLFVQIGGERALPVALQGAGSQFLLSELPGFCLEGCFLFR